MITQGHIPPLQQFTYKFTVNQYGTYWYHSHNFYQVGDGLYGALVVNRKNDAPMSAATAVMTPPMPGESTIAASARTAAAAIAAWYERGFFGTRCCLISGQ